jgi:hypothetical protein
MVSNPAGSGRISMREPGVHSRTGFKIWQHMKIQFSHDQQCLLALGLQADPGLDKPHGQARLYISDQMANKSN